jgi:hypothetical protein
VQGITGGRPGRTDATRPGASTGRSVDSTPMGFNPHRQYRSRGLSDYLFVVAGVVVALVLVLWAFLG